MKLVEMGVLDLKAKASTINRVRDDLRPPDLRSGGRDPDLLRKALRSNQSFQRMIDKSASVVWHDRRLWSTCLKKNSEALSHEYQIGVVLHHSHDKVDEMAVLKEHELEDQLQSDAVIISAFSKKIIRVLRKDPDFNRALKLL